MLLLATSAAHDFVVLEWSNEWCENAHLQHAVCSEDRLEKASASRKSSEVTLVQYFSSSG